jgi:hypothetical protein
MTMPGAVKSFVETVIVRNQRALLPRSSSHGARPMTAL